MLLRAKHALWALSVITLVVLTFTVSLGRIAIRYVEPNQQQIVEELAKISGLHWQIGSLKAHWSGLSPVIELEQLSLRSTVDAPEALRIDAASVRLSVFSSLLSWRPEVSRISAKHIELHLAESDGQWRFADQTGGGGLSKDRMDALINGLLDLRGVQLRDTRLHLHHSGGEHSELRLNYANFSGDWRFRRLSLGLASDRDGEIKLVAESYGHPMDADRFSAETWVSLAGAHYPSFAPLLPAEFEPLSHSVLNGQLWFKIRPGRDMAYSGELNSPDLPLGKLWEDNQRSVKDFFGSFGGTYNAREKRLTSWFERLRGDWGGLPLKLPGLTLSSVVGESMVRVELPSTRIEPLVTVILEGSRTSSGLREVLTSLEPKGVLNNVRIDLPLGADVSTFHLKAELENLSLEPWQGAPGASGVSGYLDTTLDGGTAVLDSELMAVSLPRVFAKPLQLERVRGEVRYQLTPDWVYLESSVIEAIDRGAQARATVDLELPLRKTVNETGAMTLNIGVEGGKVTMVKDYLPRNLASSVKTWVADALPRGDVQQASIIFRGALAGKDRIRRTNQIGASIANTRLKFHPDWPGVDVHAADFTLADADIGAQVSAATMYSGTKIQDTTANFVWTDEGTRLQLNGVAKAPIDEALKLLGDSPLKQFVGSTFEGWRGKGFANADLNLDIPLYKGGAVKPDIRAGLSVSTLTTSFGLTFDDLQGQLVFDEYGLSSSDLSASWLSAPVAVAVSQPKTGGVRVQANARLDKPMLQKRFANSLFDYVEGSSDFTVIVRATSGSQAVMASSDLIGISLNLPAPLGKAANEPLDFNAILPLGDAASVVTATLGKLASVTIGLNGDRYQAAAVTLGDGKPLQPVSDIRIGGKLGLVDAEPWRKQFLSGQGEKRQADPSASKSLPTINIDALALDRLEWGAVALDSLKINGEHHQGDWRLMIDSDQAAGKIDVPGDAKPIRLMMSRVTLPDGALDVGRAEQKREAGLDADSDKGLLSTVDPRTLIDLDLDIDRLIVGDEFRGQLGLDFRSGEQGVTISHVRGELNNVNLGAPNAGSSLVWRRTSEGDVTEFNGLLRSDNLGLALEQFALPVAITSDDAAAQVSLSWPGRPDEFDLDRLSGHLKANMRDGSFPAGDGASGALKVVGIFNLSNLVKRLQLDFSDLTSSGVRFEKLSGDLWFDDGMMVTQQPIDIETGSGEFVLSGDVDFNTDLANMELAVTLPIGNNLPWVAAVLGGLPAAAGVYVASKVFEKQMDQLSTAVYDIDGDWRQPQLKLGRVFDDPESIAKKLEKQ